MVDNSNLKVQIFTGINDVVQAPTATEGGNISHFYNLFNQTIDSYDAAINSLQTQISTLIAQIDSLNVVTPDYTINLDLNTTQVDLFTISGSVTLESIFVENAIDIYLIYSYLNGNPFGGGVPIDDGNGNYTIPFDPSVTLDDGDVISAATGGYLQPDITITLNLQ